MNGDRSNLHFGSQRLCMVTAFADPAGNRVGPYSVPLGRGGGR